MGIALPSGEDWKLEEVRQESEWGEVLRNEFDLRNSAPIFNKAI